MIVTPIRAHIRLSLLAIVAVAALSSCVAGSATDASGGSTTSALPFGQAGSAADSDRTIDVETLDAMSYTPGAITVSQGETVTFRVTNVGKIPHEFTIGDEAEQLKHAEEMSDPDMAKHDHPYAVWLNPGETKEVVWEFTEAGEFLYGCHVPGHYEAGMKAPLIVE